MLFSLAALVVVPLLVQRKVERVRGEIEAAAGPARTLVTRLQFSLSREMSSLRGFLLTRDDTLLQVYAEARENERRTYEELAPLAERLGPRAVSRFAETRTLSEQWHARIDDDEVLRNREASARFIANIATEQDLFEQVLRSSTQLDTTIVRVAEQERKRIRKLEHFGLALSVMLGLLALASAAVVASLQRTVRQLARRAEQRSADAERALAETRRANEARAGLLRGVTHDVKNPLGAALGYVELLELPATGQLTPDQHKLVEGMRRSIDSAVAIINDLLDVARADSGGLTVERSPTDVAAVVAEVVEDERAAAEAAGHSLQLEPAAEPLIIETDANRVKQILNNLLSNAIKYTPAPGSITVRAEIALALDAPRAGRWVTIRVSDTGPGIPPDMRERIFDEFARVDDHASVQGHGLGLAISRRIARLLGGDLTVAQDGTDGATFILWLPAE